MSAALGQVLLADGAALVESGALPADSLPAALIASIVEALKRLHAAVAEARSHREKLSSLLHVAVATAMELHGTLRAPAFPGVSALEEVLTELLAAYDMAATARACTASSRRSAAAARSQREPIQKQQLIARGGGEAPTQYPGAHR